MFGDERAGSVKLPSHESCKLFCLVVSRNTSRDGVLCWNVISILQEGMRKAVAGDLRLRLDAHVEG